MSEALNLHYDLFSLPTAQHRAGLAGLMVLLRGMERRGLGPLPEITNLGPGEIELRLSREALQTTLDYLYEATVEEIEAKAVRKKGRKGEERQVVEPLRTEARTETDTKGRTKEKTVYIYSQVVPGAPFLSALDMPEIWVKLWRDAVWGTLRKISKSRDPYKQRAAGTGVTDAKKAWESVERWWRASERDRLLTASVSSTLFVGAQDVNAERVPFSGSPDHNLLLHFWPVVMGVAEAWRVKVEDGQEKEEPDGFVLVVPDVSDLEGFVEDFSFAASQLDPKPWRHRPAGGVVALPQESALEYLHQLRALASARGLAANVSFSVSGIEAYHLRADRNSAHLVGVSRVNADRAVVQRYEQVRQTAHAPLFRRRLVLNLLAGKPWYAGFEREFATYDRRLFLGGQFAEDARRKLEAETARRA